MNKTLYLKGKKYISASWAAEITGYTGDYIGQLCRSKKISSTLIGRNWFVLENEILDHKNKNLISHKKTLKTRKLKKRNPDAEKSFSQRKLPSQFPIPVVEPKRVEIKKEVDTEKKIENNLKPKPLISSIRDVKGVKALYYKDDFELFPVLNKKVDADNLKYLVYKNLNQSLGKKRPSGWIDKLAIGASVTAVILLIASGFVFDRAKIAHLTSVGFLDFARSTGAEVEFVYKNHLAYGLNFDANKIKKNISESVANEKQLASSVFSQTNWQTISGWFKNIAHKIIKPWTEDSVLVKNEENFNIDENINQNYSQSQAKTVYIASSDKEYVDQKIAELKNYFLLNPLAPNVNRYYITRQNDAIVGRTSATTVTTSSGASNVSDLSDVTLSSATYGDVLMYDGSKWVNTATSSLGIVGSGSGLTSYDAWTHPEAGISATTSQLTVAGLLSTASSTFVSDFMLPSVSQGFAYIGSAGKLNSIASSSINLSWFNNDSGFTNYSYPFPSGATSTIVDFSNSITASSLSTGIAYIGSAGRLLSVATSSLKTSELTNDAGFLTSATGLTSYDAWTHPEAGISATTSQLTVAGFLSTASSTIVGNATTTGSFAVGSYLSVGTSSPFAQLSVHAPAGIPSFVVGSSTKTSFIVDKNGNVGVGTANPNSSFHIVGKAVGSFGQFNLDSPAVIDQSNLTFSKGGLSYWSVYVPGNSSDIMFYADPAISGGVGYVMTLMNTGNVGIGTTNPQYRLTVASSTALTDGAGIAQWVTRNAGGNLYFATTTIAGTATTSISALEIAGDGFGTTTLRGLNISGQATSTSNVGFNITNGCYAIGGECISGGSAGGLTSYDAWTHPAAGYSATTSALAIGTTSAWAKFSVSSYSDGANTNPLFVIASSTGTSATSTYLTVTSTGNVGIGTASPSYKLDVNGDVHIPSANSYYVGVASFSNAGLVFSQNGVAAVVSNNSGGSGSALLIRGGGNADSYLALQSTSGVGTNDYINFLVGNNGATEAMRIVNSGNVGIGTTTPQYRLTVASSTALTDGAGIAQWVTRNAGGNLYFATTTVAGTATTSISALEIAGGGFGTTTLRGLNISGQATSTSNVGFNITSGCFAINGTCVGGSAISGGVSGKVARFTSENTLSTGILLDSGTYAGVNATSTQYTFNVKGSPGIAPFNVASSSGSSIISVGQDASVDFTGQVRLSNISYDVSNDMLVLMGGASVPVLGVTNAIFGVHSTLTDAGRYAYLGSYDGVAMRPLVFNTDGDGVFGNVGIGTTTPLARLSVYGGDMTLQTPVNSSSAFSILNAATTSIFSVATDGFGTTTLAGLNISGQATSTSNVGFNLTGGCYAIGGECISGGSSSGLTSYDAWTHPAVGISATTSQITVAGFLSTASSTIVGNATTTGTQFIGSQLSIENGDILFTYSTRDTTVGIQSTSTLSSQQAGSLTLQAGSNTNGGSAAGGDLVLKAGDAYTAAAQYPGGSVLIYAGKNNFNSSNNGSIKFYTGNTPSEILKLDESGVVTIGSGFGSPYLVVPHVISSTDLLIDTGSNAHDITLGNNYIVAKSGGYVGMGTNSPLSALHVVSAATGLTFTWDSSNNYRSSINTAFSGGVPYQNALIFKVSDGTTTGSNEVLRINGAGNVGIGTSTPTNTLTVASTTASQLSLSAGANKAQLTFRNDGTNFYISTTTIAGTATTSISALEIALGGFGTTTLRGLNIVGQATSTSNVGINLTGGCFAVGGECITGGTGISSYDAWTHPAAGYSATTSSIVIGASSTPSALLSISNYSAAGNTTPLFTIASSTGTSATSTYFTVTSTGNVGVGTYSPSAKFMVSSFSTGANSQNLFQISSSTGSGATSSPFYVTNIGNVVVSGTISGGFGVAIGGATAVNYNYTNQCNGCTSGIALNTSSNASSNGGISIGGTTANTRMAFITGGLSGTERMSFLGTGQLGIGTTTPFAQLQISSTTANATFKFQLALSDYSASTDLKHWTLSSQGGNFYIASSTDLYATTTGMTALTILNGGNVGIGTTTPSALFAIQGAGTANDLLGLASTTNGLRVITITQWGGFVQNISSTTAIDIKDGTNNSVFTIDTTQSSNNAGMDITAGGGQTGNLLNFFSSGGTFLSGFTAAGGLYMNMSSSTALSLFDGSNNAAFIVNSTGKSVGIGTSTLTYNLNVEGSQSASYIARINNSNTGVDADGLLISLGVANASRTTANYFIGFSDGAQTVAGKIQGGANAVAYTTTSADLAEYFQVTDLEDKPVSGQVVAIDFGGGKKVRKANGGSDIPLGIVSTNPGFIGNGPLCPIAEEDCDHNYAKYNVLVAMVGQVPVIVTDENGPVKTGDFLTMSSTTPGAAVKAVQSGYIIGIALEDAKVSGATSTVPVFIRNEWRNGDTLGQLAGTQSGESLQEAASSELFANSTNGGNLLQLQANGIDKLIVRGDGTIETSGNLKIGGIILAGKDTAGSAVIENGEAGVVVTFEKPYPGAPKVIITPNGLTDAQYAVTEKTAEGFRIVLNKPASGNLEFDWMVVYQPLPTNFAKISLPSNDIIGGEVAGAETEATTTATTTPAQSPQVSDTTGQASSTTPTTPTTPANPEETTATTETPAPTEPTPTTPTDTTATTEQAPVGPTPTATEVISQATP